MLKFKTILALFAVLVMALLAKSGSIVLLSMIICITVMMHKRYTGAVLGIDVCLIFTLLAGSVYGPTTGAIVGSVSYFLGMLISLEFGRSPMITFYGTLFYVFLGFIFSIFPSSIVYNHPFAVIAVVNFFFCFGAFFLGAPPHVLVKHATTNTIANLAFIQIFGGLLKTIY